MIDERCTTNDDGQKQIHVCHISDLDDLHNLALNSLNSISNNVDKKVKGRKIKMLYIPFKDKIHN